MPDRIVRANILSSDAINKLSWPAEVFYRRLMSVADDFGRYDARPEILRSSLYPLRLDNVSKSDIAKWMLETAEAGLVRLYSTDGRDYLEILKFGQRLRAMKSKYPHSDDKCQQMLSTADIGGRREGKRRETKRNEEKGIQASTFFEVFHRTCMGKIPKQVLDDEIVKFIEKYPGATPNSTKLIGAWVSNIHWVKPRDKTPNDFV